MKITSKELAEIVSNEVKDEIEYNKNFSTDTTKPEIQDVDNPPIENIKSIQKSVPKKTIVNFDTSTNSPFQVIYSQRGFTINGVKDRLSFEDLENAISKNYNICLNQGKGITLDVIKMQKILKYKNKYE